MISIGLLCLIGVALGHVRIDPLVSTKVGLIRGLRDDNGYSEFLGIPYAVVDEENPFGASAPQPIFDDVFEAYEDSVQCPQIVNDAATGEIQCLNLNVYVPNAATSRNRLPVMVWIHGGAFIDGNKKINPAPLLRHDVIVVSINYRLGVYGFMCLDTPEVPGNQGLKDQVLALRWINENIEAFGGDVTKITVFGESAGGMSVNLHLFSSNEKLFSKAVIQSSPAISSWMITESDSSIPLSISKKLGYETNEVNEALSYLATVDPKLVVAAAFDEKITIFDNNNLPLTVPCVEKQFEDVESFITENLLNIEPTKKVPVILGYNDNEFAFLSERASEEFFNSFNFNAVFDLGLDSDEIANEALQSILHFYIGDEAISVDVRSEITDFGSDFMFAHPTQRMAEKLIESGIKDIYRYVFSYSGSKNVLKVMMNLTSEGATHADELGYLFDYNLGIEESDDDRRMVDVLTQLWTDFAKYGDPTPDTSDLIPVKWISMTKTTHHYINIDSELTLKSRPFHQRMAYWDLFYKMYGNYQKLYRTRG